MTIDLNRISLEDLEQVKPATVTAVSVENKITDAKLKVLKGILQKNTAIKVVLVVDPAITGKKEEVVNLAIAAQLPGIKHLAVLCFASDSLDKLDELEPIDTLESFRLDGFYNKKIDLAPIQQNKNINDLDLAFGLADKKQVEFVNQLTGLKKLKVSVLDTKVMHKNTGLTELTITNTLKNPSQLADLYPNLHSFAISYAKGIDTFDFLDGFNKLEALSVGYTTKFVTLPKGKQISHLKSLTLINTTQFDDLQGILDMKDLESLAVTEQTQIPFDEIAQLEKLKKLKRAYMNFKKESDDQQYAALAQKNGWINNML